MKNLDKIIAAFIIVLIVSVYFAADISFEMYTEYRNWKTSAGLYLLSLALTVYYGIKYTSTKKIPFYFALLLVSALLWFCIQATTEKIKLLYAATTTPATTTTLTIDHVEKEMQKGSLTGSKVFIRYGTELLKFTSSRTNYFALKDKREIKADIGRAADGNYYVPKIYWQDGEHAEARNAYWQYWWKRSRFIFLAFIVLVAATVLMMWLRKKKIFPQRPKVWTAKSAGLLYLKIMGFIGLGILVIYLLALLYMYIRYGGLR